MKRGIQIHPLNAKGRYYVDQNDCLCSDTCAFIAPNNFAYDPEIEGGYYVKKQPETPEEEAKCEEALNQCALEAIHNNGVE
jgi:ferredoxin